MNKRFLALAIIFAGTGLSIAFGKWSDLRPVQILLPFVAGLAGGYMLARGLNR